MTEGTHLHIGLLKAWELWFQGRDIKGDGDVLWGAHMIWWSRLGVVSGFLGGLIIVLDIVGEDKLKEYGIRRWTKWSDNLALPILFWFGMVAGCALLWIGFALDAVKGHVDRASLAMCIAGSIPPVGIFVYYRTVKILSRGRMMLFARVFALLMLLISAHFTLLTS